MNIKNFHRCSYSIQFTSNYNKLIICPLQERIGLGSVVQGGKSKSLLLAELGQELGGQRDRLNKRMQGMIEI